jgi:hypothetical protein
MGGSPLFCLRQRVAQQQESFRAVLAGPLSSPFLKLLEIPLQPLPIAGPHRIHQAVVRQLEPCAGGTRLRAHEIAIHQILHQLPGQASAAPVRLLADLIAHLVGRDQLFIEPVADLPLHRPVLPSDGSHAAIIVERERILNAVHVAGGDFSAALI